MRCDSIPAYGVQRAKYASNETRTLLCGRHGFKVRAVQRIIRSFESATDLKRAVGDPLLRHAHCLSHAIQWIRWRRQIRHSSAMKPTKLDRLSKLQIGFVDDESIDLQSICRRRSVYCDALHGAGGKPTSLRKTCWRRQQQVGIRNIVKS